MEKLPELIDYFLFTLDERFETKTESGLIKVNQAWIAGGEAEEEGWEKNPHKRLYGTIIAVPFAFSDTQVFAVDPGIPSPKRYISAEEIETKIKWGLRDYSKSDYAPTTYEGVEYITTKTISKFTDIRIGDRIYFDYKVTDKEQSMGKLDGKDIYRVRVDDVICVVREGKIISQGGWVLVIPNTEGWSEIRTESGLLKKVRPDVRYLEGVILASDFANDLEQGDSVIYHPDSDWEMKIENTECFAIQHRDILAKIII